MVSHDGENLAIMVHVNDGSGEEWMVSAFSPSHSPGASYPVGGGHGTHADDSVVRDIVYVVADTSCLTT